MNKNRNKHILSISMATFQDCNMSCSSFVMLKFANMTCNHKYNTKKPLGNFPFKFKVYKKRVLTSYHFNENQISFLLKISSLFLLKHFFLLKKEDEKNMDCVLVQFICRSFEIHSNGLTVYIFFFWICINCFVLILFSGGLYHTVYESLCRVRDSRRCIRDIMSGCLVPTSRYNGYWARYSRISIQWIDR